MDTAGPTVQRRAETHPLGVRGAGCRILLQGPPARGTKGSFRICLTSSSFPAWWVCFAFVQIDVSSWFPEGQFVN